MPTFPAFDLSRFELPKVNLPKVTLPTFEMPTFDLPKFQAPALPQVDTDRVVGLARDAAYAGIGLTVLAVEQAEHGRRAVQDAVTRGVRKVVTAVA